MADSLDSLATPAPRGSRLGKFRRRVLVVLLVLAVFVGALPWLLSNSPLRSMVLARVVPAELGAANVNSLSLGWLSGIDAEGVVVLDPTGQKVLEAERITISKSLLNLAFDRRDLGVIRIDKPTLYVVTRDNGSNLEDMARVVAELTAADDPTADSNGPQYTLALTGGQAFLADPELGEMWRIDHLEVDIHHPGNGPLEVAAVGQIGALNPQTLAEVGPRGDAKIVLTRKPDGQQKGELTCDNLPLAAARPWLRRWDRAMQLDGIASGQGELRWSTPAEVPLTLASVNALSLGRINITQFRYLGAAVANRPLALPRVELPWNLELVRGQLTAKQLAITTDAGTATTTGIVPLAAWGNVPRLLAGSRAVVEGEVNLAQLTKLAPELVPLRQGTEITGGTVSFRVNAEPDADALRVLANLETTALAGRRDGRNFTWDAPLRIRLAARQYENRVMVESANINSEFAQLALTGDRKQMSIEANFDLDKLAQKLGEFVDMSDLRLAGTGQLNGAMQVDDGGRFTASGAGALNNLIVMQSNRKLAAEPLVEWQANCQGMYDAARHLPQSFTMGHVVLTAGRDELVADLTATATLGESLATTAWPVKLNVVGDAGNWQRRLQPFASTGDWQLTGRVALDGTGKFRPEPFRCSLSESKLAVDDFRLQSPNWDVIEKRIEWTGDLDIDSAAGKLASRNGQLVGSTIAASLRNWMWTLDNTAQTAAGGELALRSDLARLAAWRRVKPTDTTRLAALGQLVGNVKLEKVGDELRAQLDVRGDNVAIARVPLAGMAQAPPPKPMQVTLTGGVTYRPASDELVLSNLRGESQIIGVTAQGKLVNLQTRPVAELVGTVDYDLAQITTLFVEPLTGPDVKLVGRQQAQIRLSGPLGISQVEVVPVSANANNGLNAYVLAPWESASLFGLPIGGGKIEAQMLGSTVDIKPFDFAVGGGRLTASPRVLLKPEPAVLTLPAGPLLTNVTITPEVSNRMLKFGVPILDRATQAEGKFSVRLEGATVPLARPVAATVAGQLSVSSIRVSAGPTIQPIVDLASRVEALAKGVDPLKLADARANRSLIVVRDRVVDFRLVDGRVYHQGLEFEIGDVVVRSSGSVGLDETLNLTFDATHPGLKETSIQVPVGGTLSRWEPDLRAVLQQSINPLIDRGINKALNRLFGQ